MTYFNELREITKAIPDTIVDFSIPRDRGSAPTQASSNFITNKEQGDWAEDLIFRAINETSKNYIAVRYGKSDDIVAGESGFDKFYEEFNVKSKSEILPASLPGYIFTRLDSCIRADGCAIVMDLVWRLDDGCAIRRLFI